MTEEKAYDTKDPPTPAMFVISNGVISRPKDESPIYKMCAWILFFFQEWYDVINVLSSFDFLMPRQTSINIHSSGNIKHSLKRESDSTVMYVCNSTHVSSTVNKINVKKVLKRHLEYGTKAPPSDRE